MAGKVSRRQSRANMHREHGEPGYVEGTINDGSQRKMNRRITRMLNGGKRRG